MTHTTDIHRYITCDEYGIHLYKTNTPALTLLPKTRAMTISHTIDYNDIECVELFSDSMDNYSVARIQSSNPLYHSITIYFMGNDNILNRQYLVNSVKQAFNQIYVC